MRGRDIAEESFQLIFAGEVSSGEDVEKVKKNLASILKLNEKQIGVLFSGKRSVVKMRADRKTAEKFRAAFQRAGAVLEIKPLPMKGRKPLKKGIESQKPDNESVKQKRETQAAPGSSLAPDLEWNSTVPEGGESAGPFNRLKKIFLSGKTGRIIMSFIGIIIILPFALVIDFALPVLIVMPLFLFPFAVLLPITDKNLRRNIGEHLLNCLRAIILGPLFIAGICAPVHAVFVALNFKSPVIVDLCPWVLPWYDIGIGAVGTIFGIFGGFFFVFQSLRQSRLIGNLPTSKARSAALGLAEFQGVARRVEDKELFKEEVKSDKPFMETWDGAPEDRIILLGEWWVSGNEGTSRASQKSWTRFYLEDDSGRILVDPTGVDITAFGGGEVRSIILSRRVTNISHEGNTGKAWTLMPGDPVYLIGSVEINEEAPPDATGSDRLVVRPSSRLTQTNFLRRLILGSAKWLPGMQVQDVFLLADTDEINASSILRKGLKYIIIFAILFTASSFWLFLCSAPWFNY